MRVMMRMPRSACGAAASSTTLEKGAKRTRVSSLPRGPIARRISAAAVGLGADQRRVLLQLRAVGELVHELGRDELDRGERRAELVRRRGDHAAERRELLLAGERHLGRGERPRHREGLAGHPPGDRWREGGAGQQRRPGAERQHLGHARASSPDASSSGTWKRGEQRDDRRRRGGRAAPSPAGVSTEALIVTGAMIRSAKGLLEPAGQVEQRPELAEVEEQRQHRLALAQPAVLGGDRHRDEVERRRARR